MKNTRMRERSTAIENNDNEKEEEEDEGGGRLAETCSRHDGSGSPSSCRRHCAGFPPFEDGRRAPRWRRGVEGKGHGRERKGDEYG